MEVPVTKAKGRTSGSTCRAEAGDETVFIRYLKLVVELTLTITADSPLYHRVITDGRLAMDLARIDSRARQKFSPRQTLLRFSATVVATSIN